GFFGFYDCIITVDHQDKKLTVTSSGLPETASSLRQKRAQQHLEFINNKIFPTLNHPDICDSPTLESSSPSETGPELISNFTPSEFVNTVERALDYIRRGDIYQVNLSQRFECELPSRDFDGFNLYKILSQLSPSPFGAFLKANDWQIISNSPERFLRIQGRAIETSPMKGTRPRGATPFLDQKMRDEILASPKEQAELLMITDLERNDLGKVCEYGSVNVKDMRLLEEYKTVFQATATIEGMLRQDKDAFDALKACFPGGSISGCPKIRAMEIIEELEPARRTLYTGALGYISFNGNSDFNILIRTLWTHYNHIYYQVGSGIVADSVPHEEYEETLVKAQAMRASLQRAFIQHYPLQNIR
ncbi:MAG: anthranilate synthase component I family protein, partial [Candidatus Omnitrophota bacterium]|nr:anthranilate synthase component I family protein [Candidatus Omnitrophota bacterium]